MQDILNWFLGFVAQFVALIFGIKSSDGASLGGMVVGITVVGIVVASTIGVVAAVTSVLRRSGRG